MIAACKASGLLQCLSGRRRIEDEEGGGLCRNE